MNMLESFIDELIKLSFDDYTFESQYLGSSRPTTPGNMKMGVFGMYGETLYDKPEEVSTADEY